MGPNRALQLSASIKAKGKLISRSHDQGKELALRRGPE